MRDCSWLEGVFENAKPGTFDCSSDRTPRYNCIAWAAGETNKPWWPTADPLAPYHWPFPNDEETLENFIRAFETLGYVECMDASIEAGFEKVAIYADANDLPLHAARTLPNGMWSSKIGDMEDIEHATLGVVGGRAYGDAKRFLKRPR